MSEVVEKKKYKLRGLQSKDVFPMFRIISKIGITEFKSCLESDNVKNAIGKARNSKKAKTDDADKNAVGIVIMVDIAGIVISHIADAEQEIYQFLSQISDMNKKEIESLDMVTFFEMIVDVFKKQEFMDFIGVVSKLFD